MNLLSLIKGINYSLKMFNIFIQNIPSKLEKLCKYTL